MNTIIYDNVVFYASKRNLSIHKLEQLAGLGNGVIAGWKTADPAVSKLNAVAKVLRVSLNTLVNSKVPTGSEVTR